MGSQYCQPADLTLTGINPVAFQDVSLPEQTAGCQQASELADSWGLRGRYGNNSPILLAWGQDVTIQCAKVAVYLILTARGMNPSAGADSQIETNYKEAREWFMGIGRQNVHPDVTPNVAIGQNSGADLPQVQTSQQRGWLTSSPQGKPTVGW